jgi:hypothetical protein
MLTLRNTVCDSLPSICFGKAFSGPEPRGSAACRTLGLAVIQLSVGLGLTGLLFAQTASQASSGSVFQREREVYVDATSTPVWHGKLLMQVQDRESKSPLFAVSDSDGNKERVPFQLPDAAFIQALRYNAGTDGSIVAIGFALDGKNDGTAFIAWIQPDRKRQTVIQTTSFMPEEVAMAVDGTIWSVGTLVDDAKRKTIANNVMQRYDTAGKLLSSVAISELRWPSQTPGDATQASYLEAARDRMGWFTSGGQYLEFALDGKEIGRYEGPSGPDWDRHVFDQFALSEDNQAILTSHGAARTGFLMLALDRRSGSWTPVTLTSAGAAQWQRLVGFDRTSLVTETSPGVLVHWKRDSQPPR